VCTDFIFVPPLKKANTRQSYKYTVVPYGPGQQASKPDASVFGKAIIYPLPRVPSGKNVHSAVLYKRQDSPFLPTFAV
jgi:hypothetical protein